MERPILSKQLDQITFRSFYYRKEELVDFCRKNGLPTSGGKIEITNRIAYYLEHGKLIDHVGSMKEEANSKEIKKTKNNETKEKETKEKETKEKEIKEKEIKDDEANNEDSNSIEAKSIEAKKIKVNKIDVHKITDEIQEDTRIEPNFVCSEKHRAFFKEHIGKSFTFNVAFQKWLKANAGKTYSDAIQAYKQILQEKKTRKTVIDPQFEYNTYIRDFFADNDGIHNEKRNLKEAIQCWNYKKQLQGHNKYEKTDLCVLQTFRT